MNTWRRHTACQLLLVFTFQCVLISPTHANPIEKVIGGVHNAIRLCTKKNPKAPKDPCVEDLAREIDWLEHKIETFGTVVPKQPDVWGEARMTKHRQETERILAAKLESFDETLQAAIRRSDQSFLATALTLNAASSPEGLTSISGSEESPAITESTLELIGDPNSEKQQFIFRTEPKPIDLKNFGSTAKIGLEPTLVNEQLNRYLHHLSELRRINEGDDTADSPGYALNLVRIPVSVMPGKMTRKGYGAEISLTAEPYLSDDLLPSTFRNLVINDVVSLNSLPVAQQMLNDPKAGEKAIAAFDKYDWRVSRWMDSFASNFRELARYFETLSIQKANHSVKSALANEKKSLGRSIEFLNRNSEYLRNRFLQIAQKAAEQDELVPVTTKGKAKFFKPQKKTDFAFLESDKERCFRWGVTYLSMAEWMDRIADKPGTFQPILVHCEIIPNDECVPTVPSVCLEIDIALINPSTLKQTKNGIDDISKSRRLPIVLDPESVSVVNCRLCDDPKQTNPCDKKAPSTKGTTSASMPTISTPEMLGQVKDMFAAYLNKSYDNYVSDILNQMNLDINIFSDLSVPVGLSTRSRQIERPLTPSQYIPVYGLDAFFHISSHAHKTFKLQLAREDVLTILDIRQYIAEEAQTAYNWLEETRNLPLWSQYCTPHLANAIHRRDYLTINKTRRSFMQYAGVNTSHSVTAALAWGIIVDAALLNKRLNEDVCKVAESKGCCEVPADRELMFFLPAVATQPMPMGLVNATPNQKTSRNKLVAWDEPEAMPALPIEREVTDSRTSFSQPEIEQPVYEPMAETMVDLAGEFQLANDVFKQYVRCRWPIHVFALDPVTQDQNVADVFNRRREMQLALAAGVAAGNVNAGAALRWTRRLETDIETIALNRTAVGFAHGEDTFGWRFYPRVQTPDTPGNLGSFYQSVVGGPTRDHDTRDRQLEPGIRECVAIVIMPSFVPYVTFESRASWFGLTNPRRKALTIHDTMKISRNYQAVRRSLCCAKESCIYRPGDVAHLTRVMNQMDRKLPFQQTKVQIPFENTLGGFEMFSTGVTDLAPELYGWYGAPGVVYGGKDSTCEKEGVTLSGSTQCKGSCNATTLFLVGNRFSVHDTKVIAGGKCVPFTLVSREIMRVTIPETANTVSEGTKKYVDVHVATPYGVTSHLLIPGVKKPADKAKDALEKKVKALSEKVETISLSSAQVEISPADSAKLELEAICKDQQNGLLEFIRKTSEPTITINYQNLSRFKIEGLLQIALYDDGTFLTPRETLSEIDEVTLLEKGGSFAIDNDELAKKIDSLLTAIDYSLARFKGKSSRTISAVLYLKPTASHVPIPLTGKLPIEMSLTCKCCEEVAAATATLKNSALQILPASANRPVGLNSVSAPGTRNPIVQSPMNPDRETAARIPTTQHQ